MKRDAEPAVRWIILFDSIHYVLAAERVFKESGTWCDLVPVPRHLHTDCGMAVEFRADDFDAVRQLLTDPRIGRRRVYRPCPGGHELVTIEA